MSATIKEDATSEKNIFKKSISNSSINVDKKNPGLEVLFPERNKQEKMKLKNAEDSKKLNDISNNPKEKHYTSKVNVAINNEIILENINLTKTKNRSERNKRYRENKSLADKKEVRKNTYQVKKKRN